MVRRIDVGREVALRRPDRRRAHGEGRGRIHDKTVLAVEHLIARAGSGKNGGKFQCVGAIGYRKAKFPKGDPASGVVLNPEKSEWINISPDDALVVVGPAN